jgi:ABC-type lipoprotein release transport system permease subunit
VAFVRFEPGVDPAYVRTGTAQRVGGERAIQLPSNPGTLVDFGRVRSLPLLLAGLLALLGLAAISHVLMSTVHARRRDLAVLRILGFTSFELRRVVMWYAVWLDGMALLVGVPLAVVGGGQLWTAFAHSTGFLAEPITNPVHVVGVAVAVVTLSLTVAWHAGGRASQALPASELRSD